MKRSAEHHVGRVPSALQIKHGYLDETLGAATVSSGLLQITTATMSVWGFDTNGDWSDTGGDIEISNLDEGDDYAEATRVAVYWDDTLRLWLILDVSCSPTSLPLGGS